MTTTDIDEEIAAVIYATLKTTENNQMSITSFDLFYYNLFSEDDEFSVPENSLAAPENTQGSTSFSTAKPRGSQCEETIDEDTIDSTEKGANALGLFSSTPEDAQMSDSNVELRRSCRNTKRSNKDSNNEAETGPRKRKNSTNKIKNGNHHQLL